MPKSLTFPLTSFKVMSSTGCFGGDEVGPEGFLVFVGGELSFIGTWEPLDGGLSF
jgi:hypothetical protein